MAFVEISINHIGTGSGVNGYDFGGTDYVKIDPGIAVISTQHYGVANLFHGGTLDNFGQIFSATDIGAVFDGGTAHIINEANAGIFGQNDGLNVAIAAATVENFGTINGGMADGVAFNINSSSDTLYNYGSIFGHLHGVDLDSFTADTIANFGKIASDQVGILVADLTVSTETFVLINFATGDIAGGQNAILT